MIIAYGRSKTHVREGIVSSTGQVRSQRTRGSTGDGERHAIHHDTAQAHGECVEECGGATAGSKVSGIQLHSRSGGQARHCAEGSRSVQSQNSGNHATGKRRQHRDDDSGTGSVHAGLAHLFRLLRNAGSAGIPHSLGPVAITSGLVAAMENTAPSPSRSAGTGCPSAAGRQYRWQRARSLVARSGQGPLGGPL